MKGPTHSSGESGQLRSQVAQPSPAASSSTLSVRVPGTGGETPPQPAGEDACATTRRSGVALVITLILLSVITFMAVTFLVVSRSQRNAVTTTTEQTVARQTAETAFSRALAELVAGIQSTTNEHNYDLRVSTNFISLAGFNSSGSPSGWPFTSPTNVNYEYLIGGGAVNRQNALQNIANLLYNPRPPVYFSNEFRFYLDLNRNGRFETNGFLPEINPLGGFYNSSGGYIDRILGGNTLSNYFVGDPEWVGILERPEFRHSSSNRFVSRFAYIALPIGKTLDLNFIHNYAKFKDAAVRAGGTGGGDGFLRNQGVAPFELNLASFLADLNTNYWTYKWYNWTNLTVANDGTAFDDAASLLRYRYGATAANGYANRLYTAANLFGGLSSVFTSDLYDTYSAGPVMGPNYSLVNGDPDWINGDRTKYPWAGSDNPNHFFTLQELFDRSKTAMDVGSLASFTDRLWRAGTNTSSYDRYTFYRLAAQLGTDSAPEIGRLNINYCNVDDRGNIIPNAATNFIPWEPVQFFTNAANRLLANAGYTFNVNNIQIWPTNFYTPSVHRLMQLAANIYDSTTNRVFSPARPYPYLPSVFRPVFSRTSTNTIVIGGYEEVTDTLLATSTTLPVDLSNTNDHNRIAKYSMVYGIPLVVGAKKGLPNFNEFSMQTLVQITRRLQFRRPDGVDPTGKPLPVNETNQMYTMSISNVFGIEAWNSYSNAYPRDLRLRVEADTAAIITNELREVLLTNWIYSRPAWIPYNANTWAGYSSLAASKEGWSFRIPLTTNFLFLTNATYREATRRFVIENNEFERHQKNPAFVVPHWWLQLKTRVRFYLTDTAANRIVDYVNLESTEDPVDLTETLMHNSTTDVLDYCRDAYTPNGQNGSMWCTNRWPNGVDLRNPTYGILNQWHVCFGDLTPIDWNSFMKVYPVSGMDEKGAIDFFRVQFGKGPLHYQSRTYSLTNIFSAPFNPTRPIYYFTTWQANDPLVHYTIGDLMALGRSNRWDFTTSDSTINNLGVVNNRYEPWGGNPKATAVTETAFDPTVKDPRVVVSENWDFPTNKFPSIGWLGRVHRGTPWQTVYLKYAHTPIGDSDLNLLKWKRWTGNNRWVRNVGQLDTNVVEKSWRTNVLYVSDAAFTHPLYDRYILDLFTASISDNTARGQLSINQDNLAAWSAVFGGVVALTNTSTETDLQSTVRQRNPVIEPYVIDPAGVYDPYNAATLPQIVGLVRAINAVRATNNNVGAFMRLGDILSVPELTLASPFLNTNGTRVARFGITEEAYERLPQQILGLLRCEPAPRFVIYSYGQALKPASKSLITTSGPYFQLCTNYQVTAEVATRAVVRIEGVPYRYPSTWRGTTPGQVVGVANPSFPYPGTNSPGYDKLRAVIESFNVLPPE